IVGGVAGVTPALYAAKFGATGSVQLQRSSNGNGVDGALGYRVAISSAGSIYAAGQMLSFTGGTYRSALVKFNPTGGIDWARLIEYASGLPEYLCGVSVDASENAYVCGLIASGSNGGYIAKINASGTVLFQRVISDVRAHAGAATPSGQFYVVGHNLSPAETSAVIICYDSAGNRLWSRSLGASSNNTFGSVAVDAAGNAYACGYTNVQGPGGANVLIAKYSAAGSLMWQRIIGSTGDDYGVGIAVSGSDVYFTGQTSLGAGSGDVLTGKIPDDGSKTGVVGGLSYIPSTLPDAAWTYSDTSSSAATTTITPNNTAGAYTTAAAILTNSTGRL
ncbi:MAG: SBBP repeat-containing protein, partial [Pseudomonadota bacterium]